MTNPSTPVRIRWLSAQEHGRAAPPVGPTYFATIWLEGPNQLADEWSVRLESLHHEGCRMSSAAMSFVSDKAPVSSLKPGVRFELFEGRWPVASGQVLAPLSVNRNRSEIFVESLRLLKEMHFLSQTGKDQGQQAHAVRDAMERLWWQLNDSERRQLDGLSVDLYSIGESRPTPSRIPAQALAAFEAATIEHKWNDALSVLRQHEQSLPPASVAAMRGVAWGSLGHQNLAALFFSEAVRLAPNDVRLKCLYLRALVRAGECETAKGEATRIANSSNDAFELLLAADVLFDCEQSESTEPNIEGLRRVAALAERALAVWEAKPLDEAMATLACAGFLSGAISLELIGERERADSLFATAQTLLPRSVTVQSRASQTKKNDFAAILLEAKHQVDAQLVLV